MKFARFQHKLKISVWELVNRSSESDTVMYTAVTPQQARKLSRYWGQNVRHYRGNGRSCDRSRDFSIFFVFRHSNHTLVVCKGQTCIECESENRVELNFKVIMIFEIAGVGRA